VYLPFICASILALAVAGARQVLLESASERPIKLCVRDATHN
jgi:hypothetical protein